jgi:hypothetical protein
MWWAPITTKNDRAEDKFPGFPREGRSLVSWKTEGGEDVSDPLEDLIDCGPVHLPMAQCQDSAAGGRELTPVNLLSTHCLKAVSLSAWNWKKHSENSIGGLAEYETDPVLNAERALLTLSTFKDSASNMLIHWQSKYSMEKTSNMEGAF